MTAERPPRPPILELIDRSVVGGDEAMPGPFGTRRVTYADYTASGRALSFVEDFIRERVLPFYANTHTETSETGRRTTRLREEARALIKRACGGGEEDILIFCGSGSTGAVHRIAGALGLCLPPEMDRRHRINEMIDPAERPVVFIGPYEHHSNELPWRDSIAEVVCIRENRNGLIDLADLEEALARYEERPLKVGSFSAASNVTGADLEEALVRYEERPLKVGSFSAASNVTGVISDTRAVSRLLHEHGALSFWDFAAAGPYRHIRMDPEPDDPLAYMDAVFLSPHKFVGGPGTPGVLLARRELFRNPAPAWPGGGTVAFVTSSRHHYLRDPVHREEAGTPAIVESIRAGLVFQLKEAVGEEVIEARERDFVRRALDRWKENPALEILGNTEVERLAIVSFRVRRGGRFLHHEFVAALLNDLLGIQSRAGCSCAGPYGARLLDIPEPDVERLSKLVLDGWEGVKPGWTRVNFNYFLSEEEFDFIVEAVDLVARDGWRMLPDYRFDPRKGRWEHRDRTSLEGAEGVRLADVSYEGGRMEVDAPPRLKAARSELAGYLDEARRLFRQRGGPGDAGRVGERGALPPVDPVELPPEVEAMRWFWLPREMDALYEAGASRVSR